VNSKDIGTVLYFQWQDGNGNCLREGISNDVKIENGPCASGDNTDWWAQDTATGLSNVYYAGIMQTRGDSNGYNVFAFMTIPSGDWYQWTYPT
jgi:hypothetical protein